MDSLETMLAKADAAEACYVTLDYIQRLGTIEAVKDHPEAPYWAYWYAFKVIKGRWSEGEEIIRKEPVWAFWYARYVLKGLWPAGEESIRKDPKWAYWYARDILKGPWHEVEEIIRKDPVWAFWYARDILDMSEGDAKAWAST